jgi:3,4-dihydroxy 2-butanone 4-phosphate synthase / GTP cyclohydrolase II
MSGINIATPEEIIDEARNGRMFILVDDEDRENEGDLVIPAQMATPDAVNFMAKHGRGLICLAMTSERVRQLSLDLMTPSNESPHGTAFTVSIEARQGVSTGISASDRARTIATAIDSANGPEALVSPGHVFPLIARDGGVLVRAGHTEAAVDVARLAGLVPAGVICEIMNEDGSMARLNQLCPFAEKFGLKIGTIRDLIAYRRRHDHLVECVAENSFLSDYCGEFRAKVYRNKVDGKELLVLQKGEIVENEPTLVRLHAISPFDDLLGRPGPRKHLLQRSLVAIGQARSGIFIMLSGDDHHYLSRNVMNNGKDNTMDLRAHGIGAQILTDLGVKDLILLTNSKTSNIVGIDAFGLSIVGTQPIFDQVDEASALNSNPISQKICV